MSELHEIDGIVFGGEKYTVGGTGEVPEGLIDPIGVEYMPWVDSSGRFQWMSPIGIPVNMPDIDTEGNYITELHALYFTYYNVAKGWTGVKLPSHLEEIPNETFRDAQLEFVEFGDHLTAIGKSAFMNNQLTSLDLPESLTSIGSQAFVNNQLTSVVLPDSLTSIEYRAFGSNQITSVVIPDSVTSIESGAFESNQITSVVIPDSVTSIGRWVFDYNPLTEVSIGPNTTYESSSFPSSAVITVRD